MAESMADLQRKMKAQGFLAKATQAAERGTLDVALSLCRQAVALAPSDENARRQFHETRIRYFKAQKKGGLGLAMAEMGAQLKMGKVQGLIKQNKFDEALALAEEVLDANPTSAKLNEFYFDVAQRTNHPEALLSAMESLSEACPDVQNSYDFGVDPQTGEQAYFGMFYQQVPGTSTYRYLTKTLGRYTLSEPLKALFDEKYEELSARFPEGMRPFQKLLWLNEELFSMIESQISLDLLARLYSSQLITKGEKHLLDHNRFYYKLLRQIMLEGVSCGELSAEFSVNEMVRCYAMCERALLYDWCISSGDYSLCRYAKTMMPIFLSGFRLK